MTIRSVLVLCSSASPLFALRQREAEWVPHAPSVFPATFFASASPFSFAPEEASSALVQISTPSAARNSSAAAKSAPASRILLPHHSRNRIHVGRIAAFRVPP